MALNDLLIKYRRKDAADLPIVLLMHGWDGTAEAYTDVGLARIAEYGFFVASVGMRGRNGADGARDVSGREIYDIYDALLYIRSRFSAYVSPTKAIMFGVSGGGGNVLAAACKFPDIFSCLVDMYGMSDYGRDGTNGWYFNNSNPQYETDMEAGIGGAPAAVPNSYYARDATAAITNYTGGELVLFHDESDGTVPVVHTTRITGAMDEAGLTNYTANISNAGSEVRWSHGHDVDGAVGLASEDIWVPPALSTAAWTIPASGTVTVIGYIVTKRFTVWLNDGVTDAATVAYNTATDTYTVTPLTTAPITVTITQGAKTGTAVGITEATEIVVT